MKRLLIDAGVNRLQGFNIIKDIEGINDNDDKIFIEANPECWDFLETQISRIPNSIFIKKALSDTNGQTTLLTRSDKKFDVAATTIGENFLYQSLARWDITAKDFISYNVDTIAIDEVLKEKHYDRVVIKLDIEGMEYRVLQKILESGLKVDTIYCEFHVHSAEDEFCKQQLVESLEKNNTIIKEWQ